MRRLWHRLFGHTYAYIWVEESERDSLLLNHLVDRGGDMTDGGVLRLCTCSKAWETIT